MNYYEVLQINKEASDEVIKAAYKALIKKYHPDNASDEDIDKVQLINEAYKILSNSESRMEYDKSIENENFSDNMEYKYSTSSDEVQYESRKRGFFGKIFDGINNEIQNNKKIYQNAYFDGLQMDDIDLVWSMKNSAGPKRMGYERALEEKGLLYKDEDGNYKPTDRMRYYW